MFTCRCLKRIVCSSPVLYINSILFLSHIRVAIRLMVAVAVVVCRSYDVANGISAGFSEIRMHLPRSVDVRLSSLGQIVVDSMETHANTLK